MKKSKRRKLFRILVIVLILGFVTNTIICFFPKVTTTPNNIFYDSTCVGYQGVPTVYITQTTRRGIPFVNKQVLADQFPIEQRTDLATTVAECGQFMVSNPTISTPKTWQYYANSLFWAIVWFATAFVIKKLIHK